MSIEGIEAKAAASRAVRTTQRITGGGACAPSDGLPLRSARSSPKGRSPRPLPAPPLIFIALGGPSPQSRSRPLQSTTVGSPTPPQPAQHNRLVADREGDSSFMLA